MDQCAGASARDGGHLDRAELVSAEFFRPEQIDQLGRMLCASRLGGASFLGCAQGWVGRIQTCTL